MTYILNHYGSYLQRFPIDGSFRWTAPYQFASRFDRRCAILIRHRLHAIGTFDYTVRDDERAANVSETQATTGDLESRG